MPDSRPSTLLAAPMRWGRLLRVRIEENIERHGLGYPWWIPVLAMLGQFGCVTAALIVRGALFPPHWIALTLVLVVLPGGCLIVLQRRMTHWFETVPVLLAAAWLFTVPLHSGMSIDTTPGLLALLTAQVVARDGVRRGLLVAGISMAMIAVVSAGPGLSGTPVHLVDVVLGFVFGYMLLWQMRALIAERAAREGERVRATMAERRRIAREIHDLVAHSLSVTLLQITGARRALLDVTDPETEVAGSETWGAVREVDEALADAERVGRQAMVDIRQTVSALAEGPSETHALPAAADIADLVAQVERAGLKIEYAESGDPSRLARAAGLDLYRIAQESLANIAKHAPGSTARMEFAVSSSGARMTVRNALNGAGHPARSDGRGSGLAGMSARAEQLGGQISAGPVDGDWVVDVRVRLQERNGLFCARLNRKLATGEW